jgi:predicted deacetylase
MQSKINISIDDVSPHPKSSVKVIDRCNELIKEFPDIKFSLFVPIAYWRTVRSDLVTQNPLTISEYPEFCDFLRSLSSKNFEICYHGLFHGIPGKSDNDEFQNLNYQEAIKKFQTMFQITKQAGLFDIFKPIFRPPAWRMSPAAIEAANDIGIQTLALSPKTYAQDVYAGADKKFKSVIYYNCNPPFDPLSHHEINEIVYHACEWDKNYLSEVFTNQLKVWIKDQNTVSFRFIQEM